MEYGIVKITLIIKITFINKNYGTHEIWNIKLKEQYGKWNIIF